jgi:hypothetical protein
VAEHVAPTPKKSTMQKVPLQSASLVHDFGPHVPLLQASSGGQSRAAVHGAPSQRCVGPQT